MVCSHFLVSKYNNSFHYHSLPPQDYFSGINYDASGGGFPLEMYPGYNQQQYTFQTEAPPYTACPIPFQGAGKGSEWAGPGCGQHLEKAEPPMSSPPLSLEQHLDSRRLSHYEELLDEQSARYVPDVGSARKECTPSMKKVNWRVCMYTFLSLSLSIYLHKQVVCAYLQLYVSPSLFQDSGTIFKHTATYQSQIPTPVYIPSR